MRRHRPYELRRTWVTEARYPTSPPTPYPFPTPLRDRQGSVQEHTTTTTTYARQTRRLAHRRGGSQHPLNADTIRKIEEQNKKIGRRPPPRSTLRKIEEQNKDIGRRPPPRPDVARIERIERQVRFQLPAEPQRFQDLPAEPQLFAAPSCRTQSSARDEDYLQAFREMEINSPTERSGSPRRCGWCGRRIPK
jgi:hypothetical protein